MKESVYIMSPPPSLAVWWCAGAMVTNSSMVGVGSGYIFLNNLDCFGSEDSVLECHRSPAGLNRCSHSQDVGVICMVTAPGMLSPPPGTQEPVWVGHMSPLQVM